VELLARMMGLLERVEGLLVGVSRCACQTVGVLVVSCSSGRGCLAKLLGSMDGTVSNGGWTVSSGGRGCQ